MNFGLANSANKFPSLVVFHQPYARICLVPDDFGFWTHHYWDSSPVRDGTPCDLGPFDGSHYVVDVNPIGNFGHQGYFFAGSTNGTKGYCVCP